MAFFMVISVLYAAVSVVASLAARSAAHHGGVVAALFLLVVATACQIVSVWTFYLGVKESR